MIEQERERAKAIKERQESELKTKKANEAQQFFKEANQSDLVSVKEKKEGLEEWRKKFGFKSRNNYKMERFTTDMESNLKYVQSDKQNEVESN